MNRRKAVRTAWEAFSRNPVKRYEARHDILSAISRRYGFRLYNRNLAWFNDSDFLKIWKEFPEATPLIHERRFNLFNIARTLRNVAGDITECGVFHGASSFLMLAASEAAGKHLHGFDSFEGLSRPDKADEIAIDRTFKWKKNDLSSSEDIARRNLEKFKSRFTLYKGWIPERFAEVEDKRFSLVHIDVDLYEPTLRALEFFWPRLTEGGMVICDDYGFESCPGARKAMDEFFFARNICVAHLTTGQGFAVKAQGA